MTMRFNGLKKMAIAAVACAFLAAPLSGSAQGYGSSGQRNRQITIQRYDHDNYRYNRQDLRGEVDGVERESNSFRAYFERNFRDNGHAKRWNGYGHAEHEGRNGQMSLQDAIQNLDEDFERLRSEINRHGQTRQARSLMNEIVNHMRDVDVRIDRVADNYNFGRERDWRYSSSELYTRWQDLKGDINDLSRAIRER